MTSIPTQFYTAKATLSSCNPKKRRLVVVSHFGVASVRLLSHNLYKPTSNMVNDITRMLHMSPAGTCLGLEYAHTKEGGKRYNKYIWFYTDDKISGEHKAFDYLVQREALFVQFFSIQHDVMKKNDLSFSECVVTDWTPWLENQCDRLVRDFGKGSVDEPTRFLINLVERHLDGRDVTDFGLDVGGSGEFQPPLSPKQAPSSTHILNFNKFVPYFGIPSNVPGDVKKMRDILRKVAKGSNHLDNRITDLTKNEAPSSIYDYFDPENEHFATIADKRLASVPKTSNQDTKQAAVETNKPAGDGKKKTEDDSGVEKQNRTVAAMEIDETTKPPSVPKNSNQDEKEAAVETNKPVLTIDLTSSTDDDGCSNPDDAPMQTNADETQQTSASATGAAGGANETESAEKDKQSAAKAS